MKASSSLIGTACSLATLALLGGCASAPRQSVGDVPATAEAGATSAQRTINPFVLTSAEIEAAPSIVNAEDAVRTLRPHFLRTRGPTTTAARRMLGGGSRTSAGRRTGQGQSGQPNSGDAGGREEQASRANTPGPPEDPGILVYIDRQRYGNVQTLREIPVATIEEIRFLNVGEANSLFGMGHPHGVIQIISKRRLGSQ